MPVVRVRGEEVRKFILSNVSAHQGDIARVVMDEFAITRQAVNKHLKNLVDEGALVATGATSARRYRLAPLFEWSHVYTLAEGLAEDVVWRNDVAPRLGALPTNVNEIWHYGFTEMFNNVIDHSDAKLVLVNITRTAMSTEVMIHDDGVGIFKKIQSAMGLLDERHAVLELVKGKFTTDPRRHSGEGIFFTSRSFDGFRILSGEVFFKHDYEDEEDWILEAPEGRGTTVFLRLHNHTARRLRKVFEEFTTSEDFAFDKTVVPVSLAKYGDDNLVSLSQARRLLARFDRFRTVVLDFEKVESIGQSFADEIFRVFHLDHPEVTLVAINANPEVASMVQRAESVAKEHDSKD